MCSSDLSLDKLNCKGKSSRLWELFSDGGRLTHGTIYPTPLAVTFRRIKNDNQFRSETAKNDTIVLLVNVYKAAVNEISQLKELFFS